MVKAQELVLSVFALRLFLKELLSWTTVCLQSYNAVQGTDTTTSASITKTNAGVAAITFDSLISITYDSSIVDTPINVVAGSAPVFTSIKTIQRRIDEILKWINRGFDLFDDPIPPVIGI
ncbi:hypothetical protein HYS50_03360 [Candidatus Woesearchaeota archaeon]|nr:hypothetical protein [Candidatus Woesearchaeota archaeon]